MSNEKHTGFIPENDPNQPTIYEEIDKVLEDIGDVPLVIYIPEDKFDEILPRFRGRRAVFVISAQSAEDGKRLMDKIDKICPLQR
ncbi:MAG TPA: hypothetical protein GXX37_00075 [Clostridiaceae bacterium]|nr:hypothetical protein [Clostridiaceae bacterium]